MRYLLSLIGIVGSIYMMRYREAIGDLIGEASWMQYIGGVYTAVVIIAIFILFWSIAELTNTTNILFLPLQWLLPHAGPTGGTPL